MLEKSCGQEIFTREKYGVITSPVMIRTEDVGGVVEADVFKWRLQHGYNSADWNLYFCNKVFFLIKTVLFLLPPSPHRIHFPGERILMFEGMEDNNRKMDDGDKIFDQQYTNILLCHFHWLLLFITFEIFSSVGFTVSVRRMNHTITSGSTNVCLNLSVSDPTPQTMIDTHFRVEGGDWCQGFK